MRAKLANIDNQPCWVIRNDEVELAVTRLGGHMAPVKFHRRGGKPIQPYFISPWQRESQKIGEPVLVPLRGDFFCMPFGGNAEPVGGERHRVHGEPAGAAWSFVSAEKCGPLTSLCLRMRTAVRRGQVTKRLSLIDGQNAVYIQHTLEGYAGAMPLGHHAMLAMPEEAGAIRVSTSPIRFGMTNPGLFSNPLNREYQSAAVGKRFASLGKVPTLWASPKHADFSSLPAARGYDDLIAVFNRPGPIAWTAAVVPACGFLWFSLKDPAVLPATVLWVSDAGRYGAPWSGRSRCLGLEEVCGHFADGLAASTRPNALSRAGVPTAVKLSPARPTVVNCIQGVAKIPRGFDKVAGATFTQGKVVFTSASGKKAAAAVRHEFLRTGELGCCCCG